MVVTEHLRVIKKLFFVYYVICCWASACGMALGRERERQADDRHTLDIQMDVCSVLVYFFGINLAGSALPVGHCHS